MNKRITVLSAVICSVFLSACAKEAPTLPYLQNYPASSQKKMQAAQHWDLLAKDVAERLHAEVTVKGSKLPRVYVRKVDSSPFSHAFHNLLLTRLNQQGFGLSEDSIGAFVLDYDTQVIRHKGRDKQQTTGAWSILGAGAWVARGILSSGASTALHVGGTLAATGAADAYEHSKHRAHLYPQPDTEIIVSVSLKRAKQIVARTSDIYYINDPDEANYQPISPVISQEQYARRKYQGTSRLRVNK